VTLHESPNVRPGEPLRSWVAGTDVARYDAIFIIRMAHAKSALAKLLESQPLSADDLIALGRLNSYCVSRWYEPMVDLMTEPWIDPEVGSFVLEALESVPDPT